MPKPQDEKNEVTDYLQNGLIKPDRDQITVATSIFEGAVVFTETISKDDTPTEPRPD